MSIWTHASKAHPCPVCGKTDWCTFGDRAMLCQRVESAHPHRKGGWYHFYGDKDAPVRKPPKRAEHDKGSQVTIDAGYMMEKWRKNTRLGDYIELAMRLGVSIEAIMTLAPAWVPEKNAWAFAMENELGEIVGIRLRNYDGDKWAVKGSRQGLFVPSLYHVSDLCPLDVALIAEGPTDTLAGIHLGYYTLGRPSCNTGNDYIMTKISDLHIKRVIIAVDIEQNNPRRPGLHGARKLGRELIRTGVKIIYWNSPPGIKDLREFVRRGGTRMTFDYIVASRVWQ